MRKLIATVFLYSLDGLLADEGTEFWKFCFDQPENREPDDPAQLDFLQSAYAHIMGRVAYEAMAGALPTAADHPLSGLMNAARKVVFSRTLKTAEWANTTIAAGDTTEEIDKLRQGGDGHIVVWGGVGFLRSLMRLDMIDEEAAVPQSRGLPADAAAEQCDAPLGRDVPVALVNPVEEQIVVADRKRDREPAPLTYATHRCRKRSRNCDGLVIGVRQLHVDRVRVRVACAEP